MRVHTKNNSARPARSGGEVSPACHFSVPGKAVLTASAAHEKATGQCGARRGRGAFAHVPSTVEASSLWKCAPNSQHDFVSWAFVLREDAGRFGAVVGGQPCRAGLNIIAVVCCPLCRQVCCCTVRPTEEARTNSANQTLKSRCSNGRFMELQRYTLSATTAGIASGTKHHTA
ncbi:hypothetical protein SAMN06269173_108108 [Hymenobacter mucosus]|uniref:Uncharacterized protein n=1 Tax=Hymenobacter mucosus TaxID=1411120 RepID=A0A238ZL14_9BACT|nr:hypothetical protein SAMN06269173_108108 [Hymenobacter mucosus]